ncbi:MAG: quinohemoprotein amine dehydrogenase subunit alpha [Planctomycetes bacterium]|nr:quinohemoprotein amine dehydrogenase subunit alpha [Planctomycetota bacterium]
MKISAVALLLVLTCSVLPAAQQTPPHPVGGAAPVATPTAAPAGAAAEAAPQGAESGRRGGRRGGGAGTASDPANDLVRRGVAVNSELVTKHCIGCHAKNAEGHMTRISYQRKSPEAWEMTLKRMLRQHHLQVTQDEARQMLGYLANEHGLTRTEAARGLYESERRVHWSEASADQELRESCGGCHSLGRVMSQQRDATEWKLLKAMHLAFFPLARSQAFRGSQQRANSNVDFAAMGDAEREELFARMRSGGETGPDRADRVLDALTKSQDLMTSEWSAWQIERREVPLAGSWSVAGHEVGRGDFTGQTLLERSGADSYSSRWTLNYADGSTAERTGKGVLYAGYSWRGRSQRAGADEADAAKEVLLLDESWNRLEGRVFHGAFGEIGADVVLRRDTGTAALVAIKQGAIEVPCKARVLEVFGHGFPADLKPEDFHAGRGVRITAVERRSATCVLLTLDAEPTADLGPRRLSFRTDPGPRALVLYDTVDYIRVEPGAGFARVGGVATPKQFERFEARAMHRGPDKKLWTADDVPLFTLAARWSLEEMPVSEFDDDVKWVGVIESGSGVFTPNIDGPNKERRYFSNNIGDVYVRAEADIDVWVRPPEPKPVTPVKPREGGRERGADPAGGAVQAPVSVVPAADPVKPEEAAQIVATAKPAVPTQREKKLFRARGHLLVTVPIYIQWDRYDWDSR